LADHAEAFEGASPRRGGLMSVRPQDAPVPACLTGSEGDLVSVRICEEPRLLEKLLDALASVSFPVNPQIYHQAAVGPVTIVEFPAFSNQLTEVRLALSASGLDSTVHVRNMLEDIQHLPGEH
jgi:hypothetical protein